MGKRIEVTPYKPSRKASKGPVAPKPKVWATKAAKKTKTRHTDPLKALEAIRKSRREAMARYRTKLSKLVGSGNHRI